MKIANPIYDVVFKHLMENETLATVVLSTILEETIVALDFLPQKTAAPPERRSLAAYGLDFSARIKAPDGRIRHALIEIQKAKFATSTTRDQSYFGERYEKHFTFEQDEETGKFTRKVVPIISIYFLGYKLARMTVPATKISTHYYDVITGEELAGHDDFIASLTHDSIIIQIPRLGPERRTATERLLTIFDQGLQIKDDRHILEIDEAACPEEYREVIRWLNRAVSEPEIRRTMEVEDELVAELEDMARQIAALERVITKRDKALEEKDRLISQLQRSR